MPSPDGARHERQSEVHRRLGPRRRGRRPTAAALAEVLCRGLAPGHPRADARGRAVGHASLLRRGREPAGLRLRHERPLHGPGGAHRHSLGASRPARALDRRAGGHGDARGAQLPLRPRAPRRPEARGVALRPEARAAPREDGRDGHPDALRPTRHRDAGDGVRRHSRERSPPGISRRPARGGPDGSAHGRTARTTAPGTVLRCGDPRRGHARIRARRGRARPRDHPGQREPPRDRAHGDRAQLPGEDQREHRQFRARLLHRRGGRQDDLGHPLGRRHGHGPVHGQAHPRDARVDHPQFARADRHRAHLPGAREGGRQGRGTHLGHLPGHARRAGRAGRGLLHHPRGRAPALHPDDGQDA